MSEQASSNSPIRISHRYCPRFTLRTILVVIAAVGVGCAWIWLFRETTYPVIQVSSPVISPSGNQIAFVLVRGDERDLQLEPSTLEKILQGLYTSPNTIECGLSVVSLSDGKVTETGAEILPGFGPLAWATDESQIAFVSGRFDVTAPTNYTGLDSIDLADHNVKPIARRRVWTPQYSPDGTYLGYVRDDDLMIENIQTGQRMRLQSGVNHYDWCWSPSNSDVFYIKDGFNVCRFNLPTSSESMLFAAKEAEKEFPSHVVSSPDGTQMGYQFDDWFNIVDLQSGRTTKQFKCDHYFLDFDWNATGICYLDAVDGERRSKANLMVFNPKSGESSLVASGPFDSPRWLGKSKILVRKGNTELWFYGIADGKGIKLYDPTNEDE